MSERLLNFSSDTLRVIVVAFVRSALVGLTGVTLATYATERGLSSSDLGLLIGLGFAGAAAATAVATRAADGLGRRRALVVVALLSSFGYAVLAAPIPLRALLALSCIGLVNGMGRDRGPANAIEQALLPQTTTAARRTLTFAWYNLAQDGGLAAGALLAVTPPVVAQSLGVDGMTAHRIIFGGCAVLSAVLAVPYLAMSERVESSVTAPVGTLAHHVDAHTKRVVVKLAALFALDSLGSGFVSSALVAYWFLGRYGLSERELAVLFFVARLLNAVSHLAAAWIARRIGLLNTMVATHLPSSIFLVAVPVAGSAAASVILFLAREGLVEMDVPTRQSYVMAIVPPEDRTFASGLTNLARNVSWAVGPSLAGFLMQDVTFAAPLFVGGGLKIAYDLMLYRSFRTVRAPEERAVAR